MPDPQSLIAILAWASLAILSATGVWILKGYRQRRNRMSRSELRKLGEAADEFDAKHRSFGP